MPVTKGPGCHGTTTEMHMTMHACIHDDNCEGIQHSCKGYGTKKDYTVGDHGYAEMENLPDEIREYILTADSTNELGKSKMSNTLSYIFGSQLPADVNQPDIVLAPGGPTEIIAIFKPPCPSAGSLSYELTVEASTQNSSNRLNKNLNTCLLLFRVRGPMAGQNGQRVSLITLGKLKVHSSFELSELEIFGSKGLNISF